MLDDATSLHASFLSDDTRHHLQLLHSVDVSH
jgi:hypothetical protein